MPVLQFHALCDRRNFLGDITFEDVQAGTVTGVDEEISTFLVQLPKLASRPRDMPSFLTIECVEGFANGETEPATQSVTIIDKASGVTWYDSAATAVDQEPLTEGKSYGASAPSGIELTEALDSYDFEVQVTTTALVPIADLTKGILRFRVWTDEVK